MLLTNTILANTKKFFTKTFQTFKSLVSKGGGRRKQYQRLSKTSTTNAIIRGDEDNDYPKGTHRTQSLVIKTAANDQGTIMLSATANVIGNDEKKFTASSSQVIMSNRRLVQGDDQRFSVNKKLEIKQKMIKKLGLTDNNNNSDEKIVNMRNDDKEYGMDVQEMLHYYSHITCPSYLDILDKFLMELTYNSEYHASLSMPNTINSIRDC